MMSMPRGLTAASGIDALTHALEAYASVMATDYTDGLALQALKSHIRLSAHAPTRTAQTDVEAREKMANASTMAGMAFANAFLGVCHSMAHKLGRVPPPAPRRCKRADDLPRLSAFNADEKLPRKMGTFSAVRASAHPGPLRRGCRQPRTRRQERQGEA